MRTTILTAGTLMEDVAAAIMAPVSSSQPPAGLTLPTLRLPRGAVERPCPPRYHRLGMSAVHALARVIEEAERGRFPRPDGRWSRAPLWRPGLEAVVAFTAHAVFCLGNDITDDRLRQLGANGYGGAHDPRLITAIAGPAGYIGSLDLLFVARGRGNARGGTLVPRPDLLNHPRVKYAESFKDDLDVLGFDDAARSAVVPSCLLGNERQPRSRRQRCTKLSEPNRTSGSLRSKTTASITRTQ
jgi:hypothetical protein